MSLSIQSTKEIISFNDEQIKLIKNYLCKGISDDELKLFSAVCKKTGLDPFMKQIYAVKRKDQMTIQTSIDGYRLIAERTGRYAPGRESTYQYNNEGRMVSATSYVKKQTADGTWHEVAASAYFDEYRPNYSNQFWDSKPHIMLAKCAESLALRKAFPNELSGLYSDEEMHQASNNLAESAISDEQFSELSNLLDHCSPEFQIKFNEWLISKKINSLQMLSISCYSNVKQRLIDKSNEYQNLMNIEVSNGTENI